MTRDVEEIALLEEEERSTKGEHALAVGLQAYAGGEQETELEGATSRERSVTQLAVIIMPMLTGTLLASLDSTIVVAASTAIGGELRELRSASWISTGYMLTVTSLQPLYGKLCDIFGRKSCLLTAYVIFTLGCLACGVAQTMFQLILARMLAGIGGGGMTTIVSIVLSDLVPIRSRGLWHGLLNVVWASGSSIGAPLGGYLADTLGWRWSFILQAPLSITAFIAVAVILDIPDSSYGNFQDKLRRIDFAGSFVLTLSLAVLLVGLDRGGNVGWSDKVTVTMFLVLALSLAFFILVEAKIAQEPVMPKKMVTDPALVAVYISNFFSRGCSICIIFYLPLYLQAVTNRTAAEAGASLIPSMATGVVGSFLGGTVIRATGKFWKIMASMHVSMVAGCTIILLMTGVVGRSYALVELGLVMMSLGNSCGLTTTLVALVAQAQEEQAMASAVMYLFRSLGSVLCLSVGSTLFQSTLRDALSQGLRGDGVEEIIQRARQTLDFIEDLDQVEQAIIREAHNKAMHAEFGFCVFLALATLVSSLWIKEKHLPRAGRA